MSISLEYRPEIDGLRAIAVLSVIVHHAKIDTLSVFSGGFLGVDVFFVISGFLITNILLIELIEHRFSMKSFYERRVRRILPLLFFVKLVSIPFAWYLMLPQQLKDYSLSILSSLVFGSNIWFSFDQGYWAADNALKPFLHTWSLSVEEQYYLVFPVLLYLGWKLGRTVLTFILLSIFIFSLIWAHKLSIESPVVNFYWIHTRFWEMLAGSLAAFATVLYKKTISDLNSSLSSIGLMLIVGSMFGFTSETAHPSFWTLIPIVGTALVLCFPNSESITHKLLSLKPMVTMGVLSYGAYLWHYPLFAFSDIGQFSSVYSERLFLIALTFLLSYFSYLTIEKPLRNRKLMSFKVVTTCLVITLILLVGFNSYVIYNSGAVGRYVKSELSLYGVLGNDHEDHSEYVTSSYLKDTLNKEFLENRLPKVLIIGDSFSQDFYNVLVESSLSNTVQVVSRYIPVYCQNIPHKIAINVKISAKRIKRCNRTVRVGDPRMKRVIASSDMIFVASNWNESTIPYLMDLQKELYVQGASQVMFVGNKRLPSITSRELIHSSRRHTKNIDLEDYQLIKKLRSEPLDNFLDLQLLICGDGSDCPLTTSSGQLISYDTYHLTRSGAMESAEKLLKNKAFLEFWQSGTDQTN